jgi:hypothetical protein
MTAMSGHFWRCWSFISHIHGILIQISPLYRAHSRTSWIVRGPWAGTPCFPHPGTPLFTTSFSHHNLSAWSILVPQNPSPLKYERRSQSWVNFLQFAKLKKLLPWHSIHSIMTYCLQVLLNVPLTDLIFWGQSLSFVSGLNYIHLSGIFLFFLLLLDSVKGSSYYIYSSQKCSLHLVQPEKYTAQSWKHRNCRILLILCVKFLLCCLGVLIHRCPSPTHKHFLIKIMFTNISEK